MYNCKNYTEQGGDITHIGGKLIIDDGGSVEGFDGGGSSYTLPTATADVLGGVKAKAKDTETEEVAVDESGKLYVKAFPQATHVADAVEAADETVTKAEFDALVGVVNSLLANMTAAGQMAAE